MPLFASPPGRGKVEIARRHLIPETLAENGLEAKEVPFLSDELLMRVVRDHA